MDGEKPCNATTIIDKGKMNEAILTPYYTYINYPPYLPFSVIEQFESYLQQNNISLMDAWDNINDFMDTTRYAPRTIRKYRSGLRRFVERRMEMQ